MKKVDWLKIIKISIGCCFAVFLADWIGLRSATSAGIIALLSIQNTKKETLTIAGKRISAFFYRCGHRLCTVYPLGVSSFLLWLFSAAVYLCLLSAEAGNRGFHEHGFSHSLLDSPQLSLHPNHKRISPVVHRRGNRCCYQSLYAANDPYHQAGPRRNR